MRPCQLQENSHFFSTPSHVSDTPPITVIFNILAKRKVKYSRLSLLKYMSLSPFTDVNLVQKKLAKKKHGIKHNVNSNLNYSS